MSEANVREHLANERTFLAWVRTSIALMGFGVVIAKLRFLIEGPAVSALNPHAGIRSTLLGLAFAVVGVLTLLFALSHYDQTRRAIDAETYRPSTRALLVFGSLLVLLGLASIGYLLTLWPR